MKPAARLILRAAAIRIPHKLRIYDLNRLPADKKQWYTEQILACQSGLYRLAAGILKNEQDACDALQDALCTGYEKLDSLKYPSRFRPWMMKITVNAAYDILRQKKVFVNLDDIEDIPQEKTHVSETDSLSLKEAVASLPRAYRTVVILFYYEDLSVRQISEITGVPSGLVRTRLSRARQMLRRLWNE